MRKHAKKAQDTSQKYTQGNNDASTPNMTPLKSSVRTRVHRTTLQCEVKCGSVNVIRIINAFIYINGIHSKHFEGQTDSRKTKIILPKTAKLASPT
jgi:hypothetical protein